MKRFDSKSKIGVNAVEKIFLEDFGWIPRVVFDSDVGIDMVVEIVTENNPTGKLIGVQIKCGVSYFKEKKHSGHVFRDSKIHFKYWLNHMLPVLLVMHNPANKLTIWQEIAQKNLLKTSKSFKLVVPKDNILNDESKSKIEKLNHYPIDYQRFQRLELDRKIMDQINQGNEVFLEIEDWIAKLNRTSYRIFKLVDGQECDLRNSGYISFRDPADLNTAFPWANLAQDEEFIRSEDEQNFYDNYGIWDSEDKCYIGTQIEFHEYLKNLPRFRPKNYSGEVEMYRLIISLNDLGQAFLLVSNFLLTGKQLKL